MTRPAVDVVVPFRGDAPGAAILRSRLAALRLRGGDTLTVVANGGFVPDGALVAAAVPSSYHARNRGAAAGHAGWIVFLDADVEPAADLLDGYFDPAPDARTGLLAGAIADAPGASVAERYAVRKGAMSHAGLLDRGPWAFAQTANAAVRRAAFEAVGGFAEVRSGGDADLAFRLRDAGWSLEARPGASVLHHNRQTLRGLVRQRAKHGAGAAWLETRHPGSNPPRRRPGLAWWTARRWATALTHRDLEAALDPVAVWAFELGRHLSNRAR